MSEVESVVVVVARLASPGCYTQSSTNQSARTPAHQPSSARALPPKALVQLARGRMTLGNSRALNRIHPSANL